MVARFENSRTRHFAVTFHFLSLPLSLFGPCKQVREDASDSEIPSEEKKKQLMYPRVEVVFKSARPCGEEAMVYGVVAVGPPGIPRPISGAI